MLMKKNCFLVWYTVCVVLFYSAVYLIINLLPQNEKNDAVTALPANTSTPLLAEASAAPPSVSAQAAVLLDAKSAAVLFSHNSDTRLPMASTTKIMTAKIILDMLPLNQTVTVPKEATLVEGSSIYLTENEKITVETLLYGLLLESGNDAAAALAVACSGSVEKFAFLMNDVGKQMGLQNTSFANPHGLTAENHFTTAYELAYITMCAMRNPKFREIVSTQKYTAPATDGEYTRYFFNHNKLLRTYNGANGVKTGYTEAAGRCLVSSAEKDGESYICVTLNDRNDWADHTSLLNYAFENYDSIEIAHPDSFALSYNGKRYVCAEPVYISVHSGEKPVITYEIAIDSDSASVDFLNEGTKLGTFYLTES